jgi:hypothetical protein
MNNLKTFLCLALVVIIVWLLFKNPTEGFQNASNIVNLQSNTLYNVVNSQGKELVSSAFTPIMCNDWILNQNNVQFIPPMQKGWMVKQVTNGVYILEKPQKNECLYTHSEMNNKDSLRSYVLGGNADTCNKKNLCGMETLNPQGELDQASMRTYFKLLQAPNGVYIVSVQNNMYVCLDNNGVSFKATPDSSCVFTFTKM